MRKSPTLTQLAHEAMTHEVGEIRNSEALATAAVSAFSKFLLSVSSLVGVMGGVADRGWRLCVSDERIRR